MEEVKNDLPENWKLSDVVSVDGTSAGLTPQHGYNYLMQQVNTLATNSEELRVHLVPRLDDIELLALAGL